MGALLRWTLLAAALSASLALSGCGGGGGDGGASKGPPPAGDGAPVATNNIALDGLNWINYRRGQAGLAALAHNTTIDVAAQGHADYQRTNNIVTHTQTAGKPGFTGVGLYERLLAANYVFANANHAYGEVISASSSKSGAYMAEELITAIYHRFVIFEPVFKEVGTGAATTAAGYTYFTSDFTANNGYGAGVAPGTLAVWPYSGQTQVPPNFFSDYESPDPVPGQNEVGYPISVHANINAVLAVQSFTVQARGGAALAARLLARPGDTEAPQSAAALVPLAPLAAGTTYEVRFSGTVDGAPVQRDWSFTTR